MKQQKTNNKQQTANSKQQTAKLISIFIATCLILFLLLPFKSIAQINGANYLIPNISYFTSNFEIIDSSGFFRPKEGIEIENIDYLNTNKENFGLGIDDEFVLQESSLDNYPYTNEENMHLHEQYYLVHNGIKLEGVSFIIHSKEGKITALNGKIVNGLSLNTMPLISESQALSFALNTYDANAIFSWSDSVFEAELKIDQNDPNFTSYPTGELTIYNPARDYISSNFKLCYTFCIKELNTNSNKSIYVDALNGNIIDIIENKLDCENEDGPAVLANNYGTKTILTKWRGMPNWNWSLSADLGPNGENVNTKNIGGMGWSGTPNVTDGDDNWPASDANSTTPHYAGCQSWKYFKEKFNQNGPLNNNKELRIRTNINDRIFSNCWANSTTCSNSNWFITAGKHTHYPTCAKIELATAIDVIGHEFTHGVILSRSGVIGSQIVGQTGAIIESFCDYFGGNIENYALKVFGQTLPYNWQHGSATGHPIRDMANPLLSHPIHIGGCNTAALPPCISHDLAQPDYYNGINYYTPPITCIGEPSDLGGIHINNGIQNKAIYLMSEGGVSHNINVSPIDQVINADAVSKLSFNVIDNYLTSGFTFMDSRNAFVQSVKDLYISSPQYCNIMNTVKRSWEAVGIGKGFNITQTNFFFANPGIGGTIYGTAKFKASEFDYGSLNYSGGFFVDWQVSNPNWVYTVSGANHEFLEIINFNGSYLGNVQANTKCESVSLQPKPTIIISTGGNGSGTSGTQGNGGIKSKIYISPNPTNNYIRVSTDYENSSVASALWSYWISSSNGTILSNGIDLETLPEQFDVSNYANGTFYITIAKGGVVNSAQFIKQ